MFTLRVLFTRIREAFGKASSESELHAELLAHLEALTDETFDAA